MKKIKDKKFYKYRIIIIILILFGVEIKFLYDNYCLMKFSLENIDEIEITSLSYVDASVIVKITDLSEIKSLLGFLDSKYIIGTDKNSTWNLVRETMITVGDYTLLIPSSESVEIGVENGYLVKGNCVGKVNFSKEFIEKVEKILLEKYDELIHP